MPYELVVPFFTDDVMFAMGVEFGLLYSQLTSGNVHEVKDFFTLSNQERILAMASRLNWEVISFSPHDAQWFFLHIRSRA